MILGARHLALLGLLVLLGLPRLALAAAGDAPLKRDQLVGDLQIPDWKEHIRLCANGRYVHYLSGGAVVRGEWALEASGLVLTASELCLLEGKNPLGCLPPETGLARAEERGVEGVQILPEIAAAELRAALAGAPPPGEPGMKPWMLQRTPEPKLCDAGFKPHRAEELREAPAPKGK